MKVRIPTRVIEEAMDYFIEIYTYSEGAMFIEHVLKHCGYDVEIINDEGKVLTWNKEKCRYEPKEKGVKE